MGSSAKMALEPRPFGEYFVMNLDPRTLQILKSFSAINPSIHFNDGKTLKTISPTKTVMAKATLDDGFDRPFAIYDLSRFLGVLSLFDNPELTITDTAVEIRGRNGDSINYVVADPSNIVTPPEKEIKLPSVDATFSLKQDDFNRVIKALSVLGLPEIAVVGDGEKVFLQAADSKNPTGDVYKTPVGETDKTFRAIFKSENLKILSGDYEVSISKAGLSHFAGAGIEYWIAMEGASKFN